MKTTSRFALAAAAGLFVGAMAFTPAKAADLGGDCCADLEERVAELEATTVRKGNRVVSVQLYGQVNRAIMAWDDGVDDDIYHVDNDHSSSRFGVRGTGSLKPGWTVGYNLLWNVQEADTFAVSQDDRDANDSFKPSAFDIREAKVYFESAQFGRITLGQGSAASDGTSEVDLAYANYSNDTLYNASFFLRGDDGATDLTWVDLGFNLDGQGRTLNARYDSPSIYGFILSASVGEDDYYDVALRFSKEWNSIRFAAAVAYSETEDDSGRVVSTADVAPDTETINGSFSIMHTPSGLFFTGAAAQRDTDSSTVDIEGCDDDFTQVSGGCLTSTGSTASLDIDELAETTVDVDPDDATFYSAKAGISRNFTGMGNTTIFGLYAYMEDFATGALVNASFTENVNDTDWSFDQVTSSEVDRYAFGINQSFDSAATDVYLHFEYNEADIETQSFEGSNDDDPDAVGGRDDLDTEEWFGVVLGTKIKF